MAADIDEEKRLALADLLFEKSNLHGCIRRLIYLEPKYLSIKLSFFAEKREKPNKTEIRQVHSEAISALFRMKEREIFNVLAYWFRLKYSIPKSAEEEKDYYDDTWWAYYQVVINNLNQISNRYWHESMLEDPLTEDQRAYIARDISKIRVAEYWSLLAVIDAERELLKKYISKSSQAIRDLSIDSLPGGHHIHMDDPQSAAKIITNFLGDN